ncbi:MAG TPA: hypothetical protein VFB13_08170 [Reyranella sp.]|jgi:hypothetical protein|nr:hypothetical protein [Reyranella sp.]
MTSVEYYSDFGPLENISPLDQQNHAVFGVIDFTLFTFDVNLGTGFGLTDASGKIVTKLIIGRAF